MNTFLIITSLILLFTFGYFQRNKRAKNKVIGVIQENCTGCKQCVKKCRRKALDILKDETGRMYIEMKYPDKCTACNDCVTACKFNALELVSRNKQKEEKLFE